MKANSQQGVNIAALDPTDAQLWLVRWTRYARTSQLTGLNEGKRTASQSGGCGFLSLNLHFFLGGTFSTSNFVSFRTCNQPEL
jgi:hypothetical protein